MKNESIRIVGLCGRSGSGKGFVSKVFEKSGIPVIDTDAVYHSLVIGGARTECLSEIAAVFGEKVITAKGGLDRSALSEIVFAPGNAPLLKTLNSIAHKHILKETEKIISSFAAAGATSVIIDAPLLFESGYDRMCHVKLCVYAPMKVQLARIRARDGITDAAARRRLGSQKKQNELRRLCDAAILNDGTADVEAQVREIIRAFSLFEPMRKEADGEI